MNRTRIGVSVHAEPEQLAATLRAIERNTSVPYELVVIPDGAAEDVVSELSRSVSHGVLEDLGARGGAASLNRLCRGGDADVFVLVESGARVGPRWLEHLLAALERSPRAGIAGPSTNSAWNEQCAFPGTAGDDESIARVAGEAEQRFGTTARTLAPLYSLADFCYAIRREAWLAIGEADETYGLGPCWEMDYNVRAARAGFDGLWVGAAFVWRAPVTARREREERLRFDLSKRRYQDKFCGARLRGIKFDYRDHCRGDACPNFAPTDRTSLTTTNAAPLVSCIMPTFNRREFIPQAIRCFQAQDYPNLELVVVDDGTDPVADLLPGDARIVYRRLPSRQTVGAKRNFACAEARGDIIVHWDDDDWYPASRVRVQVAAMLDRGAEISGSSVLYFYDRGKDQAFLYQYSGGAGEWVAGTTLAYRRDCWLRNPFKDVQVGEDSNFIWSSQSSRVVDLKDPTLCVAAVHPGNVSPKETHGVFWSPERVDRVRAVIAAGSPPDLPLVSCVMPTCGRRAFIPLALECFRRQTWPNRELIVIDDGADAVGDVLAGQQGVRYIHAGGRATIGAKRNRGCAEARGDVIALWDDDDWYAPRRLELQLAPITRGDADITGLPNRFVLQLPERRWWALSQQLHRSMFASDVTSGTVAFRRSIWSGGTRFPEVSLAEDAAFVEAARQRGHRLLRVEDESLFVYVRHGANTWRFEPGSFLLPSGWAESAPPALFPLESLEAYAGAAQSTLIAGWAR